MNNNREERLQMRQRGAATRKIKEVDFGFSFGLAPPPEEPSQPASQSEPTNGPPAPSSLSQPESSQPPLPSEGQKTPPASQPSVRRAPGSARNALPERPSTFDIAADEAPDLGRSNKRRKIESPPTGRRISPRRNGTRQGSSPLQNGIQKSPPVQPPNDPTENTPITNVTEYEPPPTETAATSTIVNDAQAPHDVPAPAPEPAGNVPEPVPELAQEPAPEPPSETQPQEAPNTNDVTATEPENQVDGEAHSNRVESKSPPAQQEAPQANGTSSPADSTRGKRKRAVSAEERPPQSATEESRNSPPQSKRQTRTSAGRSSASPVSTDQGAHSPVQSPLPEKSLEAPTELRKTRGASASTRSSTSASPKSVGESTQPPQAPVPVESQNDSTSKRTRGASAGERLSKSASPRSVDESTRQPQVPTVDQPSEVSTDKGKRGASAKARSAQSGSPEVEQDLQMEEPRKPTRGKRKRRGSSENGRSPPHSVTASEAAGKETEQPPPEEAQETSMETVPSEPQPAKRQRGRPQKAAQKPPVPGEDAVEKEAGSGNKLAKEPSPRWEPRGLRNRNAKKPTPEDVAAEEPAAQPAQVQGAPETDATDHDEGRQPRQRSRTEDKKLKRAERREKQAEVREMAEEVPRPGRKGKKARKAQEQEQIQEEREPEPEPEVEAERVSERQPENEPEAEVEPEAQPESSNRQRGRGRPSQSKKDSVTSQPEDRATQDNAEEATAARPKRKPRQPRGETVPVTVHRLANVASLGGQTGTSTDEEEDDGNDQESTEELSARLKAKLPNRGGVNVADVLSQICRETLEKTLTTLDNGIANEGNAARRSEYTRKKKAVEAYGTELEGRLFELSEMLDSNFVLGVNLRKAKREMIDQRTRLFQIRKEREAVALRMDTVRRKHSEEENARNTRSTINHSLHNIDLAIERSNPQSTDSAPQRNPSSSSPSVGLEFLLRSVAENASSRASGSQGGLLSQIRAFNAQLESTARKLES